MSDLSTFIEGTESSVDDFAPVEAEPLRVVDVNSVDVPLSSEEDSADLESIEERGQSKSKETPTEFLKRKSKGNPAITNQNLRATLRYLESLGLFFKSVVTNEGRIVIMTFSFTFKTMPVPTTWEKASMMSEETKRAAQMGEVFSVILMTILQLERNIPFTPIANVKSEAVTWPKIKSRNDREVDSDAAIVRKSAVKLTVGERVDEDSAPRRVVNQRDVVGEKQFHGIVSAPEPESSVTPKPDQGKKKKTLKWYQRGTEWDELVFMKERGDIQKIYTHSNREGDSLVWTVGITSEYGSINITTVEHEKSQIMAELLKRAIVIVRDGTNQKSSSVIEKLTSDSMRVPDVVPVTGTDDKPVEIPADVIPVKVCWSDPDFMDD